LLLQSDSQCWTTYLSSKVLITSGYEDSVI
jgi:hypothetical protein